DRRTPDRPRRHGYPHWPGRRGGDPGGGGGRPVRHHYPRAALPAGKPPAHPILSIRNALCSEGISYGFFMPEKIFEKIKPEGRLMYLTDARGGQASLAGVKHQGKPRNDLRRK